MAKHKLISSLSVLSRKEMTRFEAFVHSPYHQKHAGVRVLVQYLSSTFPDFSACSNEHLQEVVMQRAEVNAGAFPPILTYAQRAFEQFLVHEMLNDDIHQQQLYVLRALREHGLLQQYERKQRRILKSLDETSQKDTGYLRFRYELGVEAGEYFLQQERRTPDTSLQARQEALDGYYISEKLRDACELAVRRHIVKGEYEQAFLGPILEAIRQRPEYYGQIPAITVYHAVYEMLQQESPAYYFLALQSVQDNRQAFSVAEQTLLYNYLMNYCIARINRNDSQFLQELFGLYKIQLSNDLLLEDGYLSEWDYKNIVTTALRLGELAWAVSFIEEYRAALRPEARDNAYRFNKAAYHYEAGEYGEVLGLLTQVEYSDLRYSLGTRALLMRTYYDLDEYEALHALTESFRQYLQRNKLMSDNRRLGYYNLFRLTRKAALLRSRLPFIRHEKATRELERLQEEADVTEAVFNRSWLTEKLEELDNLVTAGS